MPELLGYHGTSAAKGDAIVRDKVFCPSLGDHQWLGDGVYFFEDYEEAQRWGNRVRKYPQPVVIEALIVSEKIFDLTRIKDLDKYNGFIARLVEKLGINQRKEFKEQFEDGYILNTLCRLEPYDVIRAVFKSHLALKCLREHDSSIIPVQIQLCVRNCTVILKESIQRR